MIICGIALIFHNYFPIGLLWILGFLEKFCRICINLTIALVVCTIDYRGVLTNEPKGKKEKGNKYFFQSFIYKKKGSATFQ